MAADYGRIHRLLRILTLIQGEAGWNARRLAVECATTERNIYRDLKMLEGAGIPHFHDPDTDGYRIRHDFFMPAVSLSLEESLALVALAEHVGRTEQVPFTHAAGKAIEKVRCNLPRPVQQELEKLDGSMAIHLAASAPPEGMLDVYQVVRKAIASRRALDCEYESLGEAQGSKPAGRFVFHPYTLFFSQRAWYAVGHHAGRQAVRSLKLNRFTRCTLTDTPYGIPDDFSLKSHLGNAWRMIRGKDAYNVVIDFDSEFAETISDTHWHQTQKIEQHEDGSITFQCKVDGLDEIVWWVLSMGPHCVVKKPKELAVRVRDLAAKMVSLYPPA